MTLPEDVAKIEELLKKEPNGTMFQLPREWIESLLAERKRMREALQFIANQEDLTFTECSLAEEIICRARQALEESAMTGQLGILDQERLEAILRKPQLAWTLEELQWVAMIQKGASR